MNSFGRPDALCHMAKASETIWPKNGLITYFSITESVQAFSRNRPTGPLLDTDRQIDKLHNYQRDLMVMV